MGVWTSKLTFGAARLYLTVALTWQSYSIMSFLAGPDAAFLQLHPYRSELNIRIDDHLAAP
jgi:hypothetical protein